MPEQFFYNCQRDTSQCKLRSECMSQDVPCDLAELCLLAGRLKYFIQAMARERFMVPIGICEHIAGILSSAKQYFVEVAIKRDMPLSVILRRDQ